MKIAVGIASAGRPGPLTSFLEYMASLNIALPKIYICIPSKDKVVPCSPRLPITWLISPTAGLCLQRNLIIQSAKDEDFLFFMDDDFLPRGDYFINLCSLLAKQGSSISVLTGTVIHDGVTKGGTSFSDGLQKIESSTSFTFDPTLTPVLNGYGCNMAVNLKVVREHGLSFDENLPMYGWLEDLEFSLQMKKFGHVVRAGNCVGVHLGSPEGRQGARRLGYSQIANAFYIKRKHSLSYLFLFSLIIPRLIKNGLSSLGGNMVRRERFLGNLIAFSHISKDDINPEFIKQMPK